MLIRTTILTLILALTCVAQQPEATEQATPPSKDNPPSEESSENEPSNTSPGDPSEAKESAPKASPLKNDAEHTTEHTVKADSFTIKTKITGLLVPTKTQTLSLSAKRWKSFVVESVGSHGAEIKKGDPLITFETDELEKKIIEQKDSLKSQKLKLAIANRELTALQQKNTLSLASVKRRMEHAETDLAYYQSTGEAARKESLTNSLQQAKDFLTYQKEELTQLLKMYEEDDITEETEEIILVRQKSRVRDAENNLKEQKRRNALTLDTTLPRDLITRQESVEKARIEYATAKLNLERQYELKKLEVAKLERGFTEAQEALAEIQEDRKLFEVIAEFDGNLFYGSFEDGQLKRGKIPEYLKPGGKIPTNKTVLTLIANDSPLQIQSLMETKKVQELQASLTEAGENPPKVDIASYPNLSGKHLVSLDPKPAEPFQFPAQKDDAEIIFYQAENTISIPNSVVKTKDDGTNYVLVKLSEGDPEERPIELGKKNRKKVEVLSGLEEGQVILP